MVCLLDFLDQRWEEAIPGPSKDPALAALAGRICVRAFPAWQNLREPCGGAPAWRRYLAPVPSLAQRCPRLGMKLEPLVLDHKEVSMARENLSVFFPDTVRERVLEQHEGLRKVLARALSAADAASDRDRDAPDLFGLVLDLRQRLRSHLAYEEHALLPLLANLDDWGPERIDGVFRTHTRQRAEMDNLVEGVKDGWQGERLASAVRALADDLLLDMAEEERGCLSAPALRDDRMIVGQVHD